MRIKCLNRFKLHNAGFINVIDAPPLASNLRRQDNVIVFFHLPIAQSYSLHRLKRRRHWYWAQIRTLGEKLAAKMISTAPQIKDRRDNSMTARTRNRAIKNCLKRSFGNKSCIYLNSGDVINLLICSIQMITWFSQLRQNRSSSQSLRIGICERSHLPPWSWWIKS